MLDSTTKALLACDYFLLPTPQCLRCKPSNLLTHSIKIFLVHSWPNLLNLHAWRPTFYYSS